MCSKVRWNRSSLRSRLLVFVNAQYVSYVQVLDGRDENRSVHPTIWLIIDKHDLKKISMDFYNGAFWSRLGSMFLMLRIQSAICWYQIYFKRFSTQNLSSSAGLEFGEPFFTKVDRFSSRKKTSKSHVLVGGNANIFGSFTPNLGEDEPTLTWAYVSNGLVKNHQLVSSWDPQKHNVEWVLRTQTKRLMRFSTGWL